MQSQTPSTIDKIKRWGPLAILVTAMLYAFANGWHEQLSLSNLIMNRATLQSFVADNFVMAVLAYMAFYVLAVALSFPGASLITIAGGLVFGWFWGGTITAFAATVGATIIYLIARSSLGETLNKRAGPFLKKLTDGFKENAFSYLLFLRLVPVFPFWLINLAPAFLNVPLPTYIAATFLGILPGTYAYSLLGEGLDSLVAAQETANPGCAELGTCEIDLAAAITPQIIAAIVMMAVISILPIVIKKWRENKKTV